jgi:hypothetical protein
MRVQLRHEWLQKHPSPRAARGDFHWYPGQVDADLRAALAEGARAGGQALWRLEPGRVTWAVSFAATAPADGRRYVGLAVTIAESDEASIAELLAAIAVLPAAPWRDQATDDLVEVAPLPPHTTTVMPAAAQAAQALWRGGVMAAPEPASAAWPARLAALETWLPADVRASARTGSIIGASTGAGDDAPAPGPMFHYLGAACALPAAIASRDPDFGRRAWRLAAALAARQGAPLEAFFDELAALAGAWDSAADLDAYLARAGVVRPDERAACDRRAPAPLADAPDAGRLWSRVVHYWGRGLLAGDGLDERLASVLARRVVADHLFHLDAPDQPSLPDRYLRRLRWESLLPRPRARALEARVAVQIPEVMGG